MLPLGFLLCAAGEPMTPKALAPYVHEGAIAPGEFGWTKGAFGDATAEEKAAFREVADWSRRCLDHARAEMQTALAERGYPEVPLERVRVGPVLCWQASYLPPHGEDASFADFERDLAALRPFSETFLRSVELADRIGGHHGPELGEQLVSRPLAEQMLRNAMSWGEGGMSDWPELPSNSLAILRVMLGHAVAAEDAANTAWLKDIVSKEGWPRISDVGEKASRAAWLLVQHADADPLFQLDVLERMEPLVEQGEVLPGNFAYLYDRVMLKLAGKQRYATQMTCEDGSFVPRPLEEEGRIDALRQEVGLGPLADYAKMMTDNFGSCN